MEIDRSEARVLFRYFNIFPESLLEIAVEHYLNSVCFPQCLLKRTTHSQHQLLTQYISII